MKRVLLIDNYDSFTYNLAQALEVLGAEVVTVRNDAAAAAELAGFEPTHLVISPGPGTPDESGVTLDAVRLFAGAIPVLGVCLGHQAIGQCFGASLVRAPRPVHGKVSTISHDAGTIFRGLENPLTATRYHSLILEDIPDELDVSARCEDGLVMGVRHRRMAVEGVQFHPESILTPCGGALLGNFLAMEVGR
ncbi:MAG: aminodeoxychorismate/anthranilate synthase component II [Actinobacteria bacterium]|jgi:anthranilate synthase/aminodeoxychorismate synthase-like glutamine amidotransferase|nr:MAG: aminodeoxychorismate/anthranilate synthase component II [Actinomycetota bacterium]